MFQQSTLLLPLLFATMVLATCPPSISFPLCCSDLGPYNDNAKIFALLCNFTAPDPTTTTTGTFCLPRPPDGWYVYTRPDTCTEN